MNVQEFIQARDVAIYEESKTRKYKDLGASYDLSESRIKAIVAKQRRLEWEQKLGERKQELVQG